MKQLRPLSFALVTVTLCCASSVTSHACDQNKSKGTSATAASMNADVSCSAKSAKNVTASMSGDCCAAGVKTTAVAAGAGACTAHGAKNTAMAGGSCAAHGAKNTAMAGGSCAAHGMKNTAVMTGSDAACGGKGMVRTSGMTAHSHAANCDACSDMDACDTALRDLGATMQVVALKNGVMYVYTTDAAHTRSVQRTMAQRKDQMALFATSSGSTHLCNDCKQMRGAAMSGKLTREIVNIEGGCLSLITSSDPGIVARIHALAGVSAMARAKI